MKQYSIIGIAPQILSNVDTSFSIDGVYGKVKLSLDNTGEYFLQTPYRISEATARRNPLYKTALSDITAKMLDSYNNAIRVYTEICQKTISIIPEKKYKDKLNNLCPKKYTKELFDVNKPLIKDAHMLINDESKSRVSCGLSCERIISSIDLLHLLEDNWNKLQTYFKLVESTKEEKRNKVYYEEYLVEKEQIENFLYGPDKYVMGKMDEICKTISSPESFNLKCEYLKELGVLNLNVHFDAEYFINQPLVAASLYATGKLSVKTKTKKDIELEHTQFYTGLSFYISSLCFNISANIQKIRVTVTRSLSGLYWVEFNRNMFSKLRTYSLNPIYEIQILPNIIKVNKIGKILDIPMGLFNQQVKVQTTVIDNLSLIGGDTSYTIPLSDARLLCSYLKEDNELLELIRKVESIGLTSISIEKKYENILKAIKQTNNI